MLNFNQLCRANRLFGRGCCLQSPCAWWADVPVNINADQAVLPTLSTHRNELWDCGPGCLQKGVVVVQSLCRVRLFVTPWTAACQASLSFTVSWSLLKFMSIESMMPFNHLILCHPLLLWPSIFPSIRVFWVNSLHQVAKLLELQLHRQSFQWISGLISFRMDWLDLLAVQGTLKSLLYSSKASILQCSAFFIVQLSHPYMTTGKTIALTIWTFVSKVMSLLCNMPSRFLIAFFPRSKRLLNSWL